MNDDATESWLKFLNPAEIKQDLIRCSIFITAWELLKEAIVDPILWFYTDGFHGKKYIRPRLSLRKMPSFLHRKHLRIP